MYGGCMLKKGLIPSVVLTVLIIISSGCNPAGSPPGPSTVSGYVHDIFNGNPIANVTIYFGGDSVSSDINGYYQFTLPVGSGIYQCSFGIIKTDYDIVYLDAIKIDVSKGHNFDILMSPIDYSTYPTKEITGHIYFSDGITEIPDTSNVEIRIVYNGANGTSGFFTYPGAGGYSMDSFISTADCLLVCNVNPGDGIHDGFIAVKKGVDLSISSPAVDFIEPATGMTNLTATLAELFTPNSDMVMGMYKTNYGLFQLSFRMSAGALKGISPTLYAISSTTVDTELYNPDNWQGFFTQQLADTTFNTNNPGHNKSYLSVGNLINIPASLTMPELNTSLGPTGVADPASLTYSSGTLSLTAVAGVNFYKFSLYDNSTGFLLVTIYSSTNSLIMPSWLQSAVSGKIIQVSFMDYDIGTYSMSIDDIIIGSSLIQLSMQAGIGSSTNYTKVLTF